MESKQVLFRCLEGPVVEFGTARSSKALANVRVIVQHGEADAGHVVWVFEESRECCRIKYLLCSEDAFRRGDDGVDAQHAVLEGEALVGEHLHGVYLVIGVEGVGFDVGLAPSRAGNVQDDFPEVVFPEVQQGVSAFGGEGLCDDDDAMDGASFYFGEPGVYVATSVAAFGEADFDVWHSVYLLFLFVD